MGDVWFGGKTKNPWNYEQGSSGSSAGSASAVAAGLVGFAIGTETWGSIVSPSTRCGTTGLRPTYGRVSRAGAMALSWTMDKIGPIARTAEDCALVFDSIRGPDGKDLTVVGLPFNYDAAQNLESIRVGYLAKAFEEKAAKEEEKAWKANDAAVLEVFRGLGVILVPFDLPSIPPEPLAVILDAEAAAAFDELTRSGRDRLLVEQDAGAWPNIFREGRLIPAVEYIQANRVRTLLMEDMARRMKDIDVYIAPSFAEGNLLLTNLTGHPTVVLPDGFDAKGRSDEHLARRQSLRRGEASSAGEGLPGRHGVPSEAPGPQGIEAAARRPGPALSGPAFCVIKRPMIRTVPPERP